MFIFVLPLLSYIRGVLYCGRREAGSITLSHTVRFVPDRGYPHSHGNITLQARRGMPRTGMLLPLRSSTVSLNRLAVDCSKISMRLSDKSRVSSLFRRPIPSGHWSRPTLFRRRCFIFRRFDTSSAHSLIGLLDTLRGETGERAREERSWGKGWVAGALTVYGKMTLKTILHTCYWGHMYVVWEESAPGVDQCNKQSPERREVQKLFSGVTLPKTPPPPRSTANPDEHPFPSSTEVNLFHPELLRHLLVDLAIL